MITNWAEIRTKSILAHLKGYRTAAPEDAERFGLTASLGSAESLLAVYVNPLGSTLAEIGVTTERLCLRSEGKACEYVKFKDIKSTTLGEEGKASRTITITRNNGTSCKVEVSGGEGKFRDSMEFLRFIERVVGDLRRTE